MSKKNSRKNRRKRKQLNQARLAAGRAALNIPAPQPVTVTAPPAARVAAPQPRLFEGALPGGDCILQMEQASLDFGGGAGVFELTFGLSPGTILGMIGPSGCGKTTTVRLLNGIYTPTSGTVTVFGVAPQAFQQAEKKRIGYIPQHFILYPNLSVEENLHFMGGIYGMPFLERRARMPELLEFIEMTDARTRLGKQLSGGMQRRLMLAGALLHDPQLLFADEPTAGIDPILRARIWENFRQLRDEGRTLLVTTQYVGEAAYCDLVAVMRQGRLLTLDTPAGLRRQAMGGDAIRLEVEHEQVFPVMELIEKLPGVVSTARIPDMNGGISAVVDDAGKRLPQFLSLLKSQLDVTPQKTEQYVPPFDEVFVRLIQHIETGNGI